MALFIKATASIDGFDKPMGANQVAEEPRKQMLMPDKKDRDQSNDRPDLTRLIQSIQRIEGNPDCYGTMVEDCDRLDCTWRELCLNEMQLKNQG